MGALSTQFEVKVVSFSFLWTGRLPIESRTTVFVKQDVSAQKFRKIIAYFTKMQK